MARKLYILGTDIQPGGTYELNLDVAKLHTSTPIKVPVIVSRGIEDGEVLLLMAGMHGDEMNGVEVIRRLIRKGWNKPQKGMVICIPVFNIFGFLNVSRDLPDGRDLNRSFPGTKNGSLASQFAFHFMKEVAPFVDYIIDFHTGAAQRNNYPQIRCIIEDEVHMNFAKVFNPPFIIHSSTIAKTVREALYKKNKKLLLFEGGKTNSVDEFVVSEALEGVKRVMHYLDLRHFKIEKKEEFAIVLKASKWLRASHSGMLLVYVKNGDTIKTGDVLGVISDPFGKTERKIRSTIDGYVFCVNEAPVVNKGDAIFNIGSEEVALGHGLHHSSIKDY